MRFYRQLHIEYILIFIAVMTFSSTAVFKSQAMKKFDSLDQKFIEIQKSTLDISEIEKDCIPYTYFDKNLEKEFKSLSSQKMPDADSTFAIEVSQFQNEIHKSQRMISFGYDSFLYFSAILFLIALGVILTKKISQKAEFERREAISEEQKNFSRNLHDGVAQDLAAIKIYHKTGDDDKAAFYTDRALSEVRYLIDSSRLEFDEDFEFLIKKMLSAFEANHEIKTTVIITSDFLGKLKSSSQVEILHILQEALSNIARHANASEVKLRITDVVDEMHIAISDNGTGFSEEAVESQKSGEQSAKRKHWGLNNIRERVQKLHGTVEFINDGGTTVAISIKNPVS
ncbi:sensor histidine kinase [Treponema zioleckii]|uniref:sensor histidine kinase n=1 Tax=Treponema zioleckii TaxID=331680 RepID=UPI00168B6C18|nr:ATP-binding protein [Treponema zioleckii]